MESLLKFVTTCKVIAHRRLIHSWNCPLCRREMESIVHVMWRCDFARSLSRLVGHFQKVAEWKGDNFADFFL